MQFSLNDKVHGFRVDRITDLCDIKAMGYEMTHEKVGPSFMWLPTMTTSLYHWVSDASRDDTGVAHITEHSVLCGSRKYPVKEPFVELVKGSLNTFLNAMTYSDKTVYPVASRNDKDFRNLVDVYS